MNKFCMILLAVALPVFIYITAMESAVFDRDFFMEELDKNRVTETTGILSSEYGNLTDDILDCLMGRRADVNIHSEISDDRYIPIFSDDEKIHMQDVRQLIQISFYVQIGALAVALVTGTALVIRNRRGLFAGILAGSLVGLVSLAAVTGACMVDFTSVFVALHKLVFTNMLWYLDPAESLLINIVPEGYFIDLAVRIGITAGIIFLIAAVIGIAGLVRTRAVSGTGRTGRRGSQKF